jgi:hypothetical protein
MSVDIVLKNGQSGYDAVGEYVEKYWEQNGYATAIVALETSYEGKEYLRDNEVVSPTENCESLEFLYDWWEGQKYIKLLGIRNLHEIELIPTADVVEVRHSQIKWVNRPISAQYATVTDENGEKHYGKVCDRIENNTVGYCEECGKRLDDTFMNYCPNCGAKMDGERREE